MQRRAAFTLVELVTVVAVIAVLVALLLPALRAVRARGHALACETHLRQLAQAFDHYAADHRGFAPPEELSPAWDMLLAGYVAEDRLFVCPGDGGAAADDDLALSYTWRDGSAAPAPGASVAGRRIDAAHPRDAALVFDLEPSWHGAGAQAWARLDGSATLRGERDLAADLLRPVW